MTLVIVNRPGGRFIVKRDEPGTTGLWAALGPWYTRERAQMLADSLTQEAQDAKRHRRSRAAVEAPPHPEAAREQDGEDRAESSAPEAGDDAGPRVLEP